MLTYYLFVGYCVFTIVYTTVKTCCPKKIQKQYLYVHIFYNESYTYYLFIHSNILLDMDVAVVVHRSCIKYSFRNGDFNHFYHHFVNFAMVVSRKNPTKQYLTEMGELLSVARMVSVQYHKYS